jgi:hypothetical protein
MASWVMAHIVGLGNMKAQFDKVADPKVASLHMGAALRKAAKPALDALKAITPKGPTGNLRKSSMITVRNYWNQGNAAAFIEHKSSKRLGKRGRHSSILEHGTRQRFTKGRIASSYYGRNLAKGEARNTGFKINQKKVAKSGKNKGKVRFTTTPKYPKAFFKSAPKGEKVALGTGPALHLVSRAYSKALPQLQTEMLKELNKALAKAIAQAGFTEGT